jgi:hypothetical protein
MAYPETILEKKYAAYVWFANAVASEDPNTKDHDKRMKLAKEMATMNPSFDAFVTVDMNTQGFDSQAKSADIQNRISGLATNLIALGFGD